MERESLGSHLAKLPHHLISGSSVWHKARRTGRDGRFDCGPHALPSAAKLIGYPGVRMGGEAAMVWLMVFVMYAAPDNAVDWNGPWKFGMSRAPDQVFQSEADCRNYAIQFIGRMHQGMLAPMRFKCVAFESSLPKGAQR
jgi:hypothetical protein